MLTAFADDPRLIHAHKESADLNISCTDAQRVKHDWVMLFRAGDDGSLLPLASTSQASRQCQPGGAQGRPGWEHAYQQP